MYLMYLKYLFLPRRRMYFHIKVWTISKHNGLQVFKNVELVGNLKIFSASFFIHAICSHKLLTIFQYDNGCGNERKTKWTVWKPRFLTFSIFIFKIFPEFCWNRRRFLALAYHLDCPSQDMVQKFSPTPFFVTFSEAFSFYSNSVFWVVTRQVMFPPE